MESDIPMIVSHRYKRSTPTLRSPRKESPPKRFCHTPTAPPNSPMHSIKHDDSAAPLVGSIFNPILLDDENVAIGSSLEIDPFESWSLQESSSTKSADSPSHSSYESECTQYELEDLDIGENGSDDDEYLEMWRLGLQARSDRDAIDIFD